MNGHDVGGADARVLALVRGEVDELARLGDAGERGVHRGLHGRDEREDGAVVGRVGRDVEDGDAVDGRDGVADRGDDLGAAAFGEVGDALDELHGDDG